MQLELTLKMLRPMMIITICYLLSTTAILMETA